MADNMTEQVQGSIEQNVKPEVDRSTPVVVLYRGGKEGQPTNPFMAAVVEGLRARGLNVLDRPIDPEVVETQIIPFGTALYAKEKAQGVTDPKKLLELKEGYEDWEDPALEEATRAAIGEVAEGSIIITDNTLETIGWFLDEQSIQAYEVLGEAGGKMESIEDIKKRVEPVVEAIRAGGKTPVILPYELGQHLSLSLSDEERQQLEQSIIEHYSDDKSQFALSTSGRPEGKQYIEAIRTTLGVPVIKDEFLVGKNGGRIEVIGTIFEELQSKNIPPENAVVLVDHHETYLDEGQVKKTGLDQVDEALICTCCIGLNGYKGDYIKNAEAKGFRFYPMAGRGSNLMEPVIDRLVSQIQEREAAKEAANK